MGSGLMSHNAGRFWPLLVTAPAYLADYGSPTPPQDPATHSCLRQRSPSTGKLRPQPLDRTATIVAETVSANVVDLLIHLVIAGHGTACLRRSQSDRSFSTVGSCRWWKSMFKGWTSLASCDQTGAK